MKIELQLHVMMACAAAVFGLTSVSRAQQVLVVPENHTWNFLHPMGAVPPRADSTPDPDFETSWYLPQAQFATNYDGPGFVAAAIGDPLVLTSADSGPGAGPFAYDVVDGITTPGTTLTLPAAGSRNTSYFRTTFTVPAGGLIEPSIRMVCDDGCYLYLDGVLVATVNIANGVADTYTAVAADAANTEIGFTFPLRAAGLQAGGSPGDVSVLVPIPALTAGSHTLTVSVHNNIATSSDLGLLLELSALNPATPTIHAVITDVVLDTKGTPANVADDQFSFKATLTGNNPGATWSSDNPVRTGPYGVATVMGPYNSASGPATVTFTTASNPAAQISVTVDPPSAFTTLVDYNHVWKVMNPLGGVIPPRPAGGADTDYETTWFLKENNFVTQYDGPIFGADGVAESYEAITGPGPFAAGGIDGIAAGQPVGAAGTVLTLPATGNRRASYYRTTFTTTQPMSLVTFEVLCDDGVYLYLDGNLVAQENMPAVSGFLALAPAARGETLLTTIDLSLPPEGNVIATVPGLAPGVHTLAMSLHQNGVTSTDLGVALKMSGIEVVGQRVIEASVSNVVRSDAGTPGAPADDTFTFNVTVTGANAGAGWNSNSVPASGSYGAVTGFGPFLISEGNKVVQFSTSIDPATATSITVIPPPGTMSAVASGVTRDNKGTLVDPSDDTISFNVVATGSFLSNQWNSNVGAPASGAYDTAVQFGPFPANLPVAVILTDSVDIARTVSFTVHPPRYVPVVEIVPYTQSWKIMNPQGGVVPEGAGGPDDDFESTWFLAEPAFAAQYNGPAFGAGGVAGSFEAIEGAGPFAVGGLDGLAAGTTVGPAGTTIALPAIGSRFTSYYRTTFTTTQTLDNLRFDLLCDDGVFIYLDGVLVAQENMTDTDSFAALAFGPRNEGLINTIDLSAAPAGNVITHVAVLPAGTHTLAVSLHQNTADSSDKGLALTFYGRPGSGASISLAMGAVTRNLNNTLSPADDTFQFSGTLTAVNGSPGGWISNTVPATGSYGALTQFGPFPIIEAPKFLIFTDPSDPLVRTTATAAPPPVFGLTVFNGTIGTVPPILPLPANWTANGAAIAHSTSVGVVDPGTQITSEIVNLADINGPVQFTMDLTLADTSTTTNFEAADTVLAELVLNDGVTEQRVSLISAFDSDGNGVLNGFTGLDAAEYNAGKILDELNGGGVDAEVLANHTFALSGVIPDNIISAQVAVTVVALGGSESVTLSNVIFSPAVVQVDTDGDGWPDALETIAGTSPTDPGDYLRITGITPGGGGATIVFPSKTGRNYRVEVSGSLRAGWTAFGDPVAGTGTDISATLPLLPLPGQPRYFLRVRVIP